MSQEVFIQRTSGQSQNRLLGQLAPDTATAFSIYSPDEGVEAVVKTIYVTNRGTGNLAFSLFHDEDGTTWNNDSVLINEFTITADNYLIINDANIFMGNSSGSLAVRSDTADSMTVTVYGTEIQTRAR